MRSIIAILFIGLIFSGISFAETQQALQAIASETVLQGWNCDPNGGPAQYLATVYVENPYDSVMYLSYSYFDYYAAQAADGGRFCVIPARGGQHCNLLLPLTLGGAPAGNASVHVQVMATIEGLSGQLETGLDFTLIHTPPSTETGVLAMIGTTQARADSQAPTPESLCANANVCCTLTGLKGQFSSANASLGMARELLKQCRFSEATSAASAASEGMNLAVGGSNATLKACRKALDSYSSAQANFSAADLALRRRAACGINVTDSRSALQESESMLTQAADKITGDSYSDALLFAEQARIAANRSINLADNNCPPLGFVPQDALSTPAPSAPPQQPIGGDVLSGAIGALGYIVIAAIIIVVGAAIYVSLGKRHLDNLVARGPRLFDGKKSAPPAGKDEELPPMDHSKVEEEFQDWLKGSNPEEKGEKPKRGKAK